MYTLQTNREIVKQDHEIQRLKTLLHDPLIKEEKHIVFWGDPEPRFDNVLWIWYEWFIREPGYNIEWCTPENAITNWKDTIIISNHVRVPYQADCTYYLLGLSDHFPMKGLNTFFITDHPAPDKAIPTPYGDYLDQCLYVNSLYQTRSFTHEYKAEQDYILQWPGIDVKALCSIMHLNSQTIELGTNVETVRFLTERATWIPLLEKSKYALWTLQQKKTLITTDLETFRHFGEQGLYHPSLETLHEKITLLSTSQKKNWAEKLEKLYQHFTYPKWLSFMTPLPPTKPSIKIIVDDEKDRDLMKHILQELGMMEDEKSAITWYRVKDGSQCPPYDTHTIAWFTPESELDWTHFSPRWIYVMGHDTVRTEWIKKGSPGLHCPWMIRPCEPFLSEKPYDKKKATWKSQHPPRARHIICKDYPLLPFTSIIWKRIQHQSTFWLPDTLIPQANEWFHPNYSPWVKTYTKNEKPGEIRDLIWATD